MQKHELEPLNRRRTREQLLKRQQKIRRRRGEETGRETKRSIQGRTAREWFADVWNNAYKNDYNPMAGLGEAIAAILGGRSRRRK